MVSVDNLVLCWAAQEVMGFSLEVFRGLHLDCSSHRGIAANVVLCSSILHVLTRVPRSHHEATELESTCSLPSCYWS